MCVPICTDTRVHTRHTAVSPDLHPMMLASTGKEQMDWLGLTRMDTQGNQICLFDVENPKQNEPLLGELLGGGVGNWDKRLGSRHEKYRIQREQRTWTQREQKTEAGPRGSRRQRLDPKGCRGQSWVMGNAETPRQDLQAQNIISHGWNVT